MTCPPLFFEFSAHARMTDIVFVFVRLISGLQGSTSTQIAKEYYNAETKEWFENMPLFVRAVGSHRER
jgi:hypothetical protein